MRFLRTFLAADDERGDLQQSEKIGEKVSYFFKVYVKPKRTNVGLRKPAVNENAAAKRIGREY
jgi:hypothetical protein